MVEQEVQQQTEEQQRAERLLEIEEQLAEEHRNQGPKDVDEAYDLRLSTLAGKFGASAKTARVLEADHWGDKLRLEIEVDGKQFTRSLPWPDDTTNPAEPVVRLCNWADVEVDRFADIDEVPVEPDRYKIYLPKGHRKVRTSVTLPGGFTCEFDRITLKSRLSRISERVLLQYASLPLFGGTAWQPVVNDTSIIGVALIAFAPFIVTIGMELVGNVPPKMIMGSAGLSLILVCVLLLITMEIDIGGPFDTYR